MGQRESNICSLIVTSKTPEEKRRLVNSSHKLLSHKEMRETGFEPVPLSGLDPKSTWTALAENCCAVAFVLLIFLQSILTI